MDYGPPTGGSVPYGGGGQPFHTSAGTLPAIVTSGTATIGVSATGVSIIAGGTLAAGTVTAVHPSTWSVPEVAGDVIQHLLEHGAGQLAGHLLPLDLTPAQIASGVVIGVGLGAARRYTFSRWGPRP